MEAVFDISHAVNISFLNLRFFENGKHYLKFRFSVCNEMPPSN